VHSTGLDFDHERTRHATADKHASLGRDDMDVEMAAWQQSLGGFHERAPARCFDDP
jgi:hypothetical protein